MIIAIWSLAILLAMDVILSMYGVALGATETNPLPWARPEYMAGAKFVAFAIVVACAYPIRAWRFTAWFMRACAAAMLVVVVNNAWVITGM